MDTLPVELVAFIFTFLRERSAINEIIGLRSLLYARLVCRLFWSASLRDEVWEGRFPWGNEALDRKFEGCEVYRKKMFQQRLVIRYARLMGCYSNKLWEDKDKIIESYAHWLWLQGGRHPAFVNTEFPIGYVQRSEENMVSGWDIDVCIDWWIYIPSVDDWKRIIPGILETFWPRLGECSLTIVRGEFLIPHSFVVEDIVLRTKKLFRFGIFG